MILGKNFIFYPKLFFPLYWESETETPGGACSSMRKQKKRKGTFLAGQCAALSSYRVGKMLLFFQEKDMLFTSLLKRCDLGTKLKPVSTMFAHTLLVKNLGFSKLQ